MKGSSTHELFRRHAENPILSADDWPYAANAVFNPAAAIINGQAVLLVRVEDFRGMSHLTVAKSDDGIQSWIVDPVPSFIPQPATHPEEQWGIEDPRATWLKELDAWAIAYTAYSKGGPLVSLATTRDFRSFDRLGPVMPPEDKDAALFPVRFDGRWAMLHRPVTTSPRSSANIWISFSHDLKYWGDHRELLRARAGGWWDANKIGLSTPPLETPEGWLILYHGVRETASGAIYRLGLAMLDREDPTRVLKRSDPWVFGPRADYERNGDVDDVVFPCGWVLKEDEVFLYYGAADSRVALATACLTDLIDYIMLSPTPGENDE